MSHTADIAAIAAAVAAAIAAEAAKSVLPEGKKAAVAYVG